MLTATIVIRACVNVVSVWLAMEGLAATAANASVANVLILDCASAMSVTAAEETRVVHPSFVLVTNVSLATESHAIPTAIARVVCAQTKWVDASGILGTIVGRIGSVALICVTQNLRFVSRHLALLAMRTTNAFPVSAKKLILLEPGGVSLDSARRADSIRIVYQVMKGFQHTAIDHLHAAPLYHSDSETVVLVSRKEFAPARPAYA